MTSTPSVGIIGSGFGGLAAAIELQRHGITTYTVLERGASVGGTWRDNTYPGAACDVPSSIYSYSFELDTEWSARFGSQPEIHAYLQRCADKYGVSDRIRFHAEVTAATWDETQARWTVELAGGEELEFDALICATGQLSRPKIPDLPGVSTFRGKQFHSAQWDHRVDLTGQRVAVVGSGASAIQVVPAIADQVAEITVIQRSPNWVMSKHNHRYGSLERALLRYVPGLNRLHHNLEWLYYESRYPLVLRAVDPIRPLVQEYVKRKIRQETASATLAAQVTPDYPIGCNRVLISNDWYPTLARPHVELVASGVRQVTPEGLVTADGRAVEVDVIIWCTGFAASEYLAPIRITGRDGRVLHQEWKDGPEAYLGTSVAGFPNLFMIYGPNTNSLTNTVIFLLEKQARYARLGIDKLREPGGFLDVKADVQQRYNASLHKRLGGTVFTAGCPGWYTTADGKVVAMWPGSHVEYARATSRFDTSRYEVGRTVRSADTVVAR